METLGPGQLRFRVHGPDMASDYLSAIVFADKLSTLVRAIKAADKAVNAGTALHDYVIAKLQSSTPTVTLFERPLPRFENRLFGGNSGIRGFGLCAEAITAGERDRALLFGSCAKFISRLAKNAQSKFSYAEVWTEGENVIRVDPFLTERADAIIEGTPKIIQQAEATREVVWFEGVANGAFDGEIRAVDLRGALPELKLLLSAGGKQIDCVCRGVDIEVIRSALNRRVRISGRAIYDGYSGLPRRLEASEITIIDTDKDFKRWKDTFEQCEILPWEGDD